MPIVVAAPSGYRVDRKGDTTCIEGPLEMTVERLSAEESHPPMFAPRIGDANPQMLDLRAIRSLSGCFESV